MLEPDTKYKVIESTPLVRAGTPVIVDKDSTTKEPITGKTGMTFCRMPQGGSLFFEESNLKAVD